MAGLSGVLVGFAVIAVVIALGYLLARRDTLGPHGQQVLARLVFTVGTPALLFTTLADADVHQVFSGSLLVAAVSALTAAAVYVVLALTWLRRPAGEVTVGALSASYGNAGNLGIPIAVYVLGSASYVAPVMLFQMAVLGPVAAAILDACGDRERVVWWRQILRPLLNPILVASALGLVVAAVGWDIPDPVAQPIELVAGLAVPGALLAFGISLRGAPLPGRGELRRQVWTAATIKVLVQPLVAFAIASFLLDADRRSLLAATVLAALPTAHNVFVYASRYRIGVLLARESVLISSALSAVVIMVVAALLG